MGGKQNVIEINGKKYDAATGKLLGGAPRVVTTTVGSGGNIDGFTRHKPIMHASQSHAASGEIKRIGPARLKAAHSKKSVQKSQTLMRSAVKKPEVKASVKTEHQDTKSRLGISMSRMKTAKNTPTSPKIHRYNSDEIAHNTTVTKKIQPLAVKQPFAMHALQNQRDSISTHMTPHRKPHMSAAAKMIEESLAHATAHNNPRHEAPKKRRKIAQKFGVSPRALAISSTVLAGVLLGGFFAIQNVPNLSMRVAAARAGFDAKMPGYNPSGFSFNGPINYTAGRVTVSFESNVDDRQYDVTQRASNWNSDALLANYILEEGKQYQTYVERGRTLYIYDGSNATWVDNGVWYQVEGESAMTTDQLIRIASSI